MRLLAAALALLATAHAATVSITTVVATVTGSPQVATATVTRTASTSSTATTPPTPTGSIFVYDEVYGFRPSLVVSVVTAAPSSTVYGVACNTNALIYSYINTRCDDYYGKGAQITNLNNSTWIASNTANPSFSFSWSCVVGPVFTASTIIASTVPTSYAYVSADCRAGLAGVVDGRTLTSDGRINEPSSTLREVFVTAGLEKLTATPTTTGNPRPGSVSTSAIPTANSTASARSFAVRNEDGLELSHYLFVVGFSILLGGLETLMN